MNKRILFSIVILTVAIDWNLEQNKETSSNMSNLTLANIEALADGETCEICYGFALRTHGNCKVCESGSFGPCNIFMIKLFVINI